MAKYVHELLNQELLSTIASEPVTSVLLALLGHGISAAPVLGEDGRPIGIVTLRDLVGRHFGDTVGERMAYPVQIIATRHTIVDAARQMSEHNIHHLIAVDEDGVVAGLVSSLNLVRALAGLPISHPPAFSHRDEEGVIWSDPLELRAENLAAAPKSSGLFVLIRGQALVPELPMWVESAADVRTRLKQLIENPTVQRPALSRLLTAELGRLRFRAAAVRDPDLLQSTLSMQQGIVQSASGTPVAP